MMDSNVLQSMIDIVFSGNMLYLSPILFFLMVVLFAESLIDLLKVSISGKSDRRGSY